MDDSSASPRIEVYTRVETAPDLPGWLQSRAARALPLVFRAGGSEDPVLPSLDVVEVTVISDETIAGVHGEFLDDPTPTDVITFHHGEILISADTAAREAGQYEKTVDEEILLYLIHGLLHLNGHTDLREPDRTVMHRIQEDILSRVLAEDGGDSRDSAN